MDSSNLDNKYFIDSYKYNCPYCKRRHVSYSIPTKGDFDWDTEDKAYYFIAHCNSCGMNSLHLSFENLLDYSGGESTYRFKSSIENEIDDKIIYSRPTTFFTMDLSIKKNIRELVVEAEQSLQFNLLTGASASLRKAIYTLLKNESSIVVNDKTGRTDYKSSIKTLEEKFPFVQSELFEILSTIQGLASNPVHEDAWETWDSASIRYIIELTKLVLNEMYTVPAQRKNKKQELYNLKTKLSAPKK